jgi:hypothetical protein
MDEDEELELLRNQLETKHLPLLREILMPKYKKDGHKRLVELLKSDPDKVFSYEEASLHVYGVKVPRDRLQRMVRYARRKGAKILTVQGEGLQDAS